MRSSSIPQSSISTTDFLSHTLGTRKQSYSRTGKKAKSHVSLLFISKYRRLQRFWKRGNICQCHPEPSCTALSICLCSPSNRTARTAINLTHSQHGEFLSWPLGDDTNQICSQPSPVTSTAQLSPSGEIQTWGPNLEKEKRSSLNLLHIFSTKDTIKEVPQSLGGQSTQHLPGSSHIPFFLKGLQTFLPTKWNCSYTH